MSGTWELRQMLDFRGNEKLKTYAN